MTTDEFRKTADWIIRESIRLSESESLCIVTEHAKMRMAVALADAADRIGAEDIMCVMRPREMHGRELPKVVAQAMSGADAVIGATTYAITHTEARRVASRGGTRTVILRSVEEDSFTEGGMRADYGLIRVRTRRVAEALATASAVRVTSEKGTDLAMQVGGRGVLCLDGFAEEPGSLTSLPSGEAALSPIEGTATGMLVVDHLIDGIGLLTAPVRITVAEGEVVDVQGGPEAFRLRELIDQAGPGAANVAEFAVGTNPESRMVGNPAEDKVKLGCIHIGIGDNQSLGGRVLSELHLDLTVLFPTVIVDGWGLLVDGQLVDQAKSTYQ